MKIFFTHNPWPRGLRRRLFRRREKHKVEPAPPRKSIEKAFYQPLSSEPPSYQECVSLPPLPHVVFAAKSAQATEVPGGAKGAAKSLSRYRGDSTGAKSGTARVPEKSSTASSTASSWGHETSVANANANAYGAEGAPIVSGVASNATDAPRAYVTSATCATLAPSATGATSAVSRATCDTARDASSATFATGTSPMAMANVAALKPNASLSALLETAVAQKWLPQAPHRGRPRAMRFRSQLTEAMARQGGRQLSPPRPSPLRKLSVGCIDLAAVVTFEQKSRLWTQYFVCLECAIVYIVLFTFVVALAA